MKKTEQGSVTEGRGHELDEGLVVRQVTFGLRGRKGASHV